MIVIRRGDKAEIDVAVDVYERSSFAYHKGDWPRAKRVEDARSRLHAPDTWFLLAMDALEAVGMACVQPLKSLLGTGPVIPDAYMLAYFYIAPNRWGERIGGALLDKVIAEAKLLGAMQINLWAYADNERAHRLYGSRGFRRTGQIHATQEEWSVVLPLSMDG